MATFQVITDGTGKALAVMAYCPVELAQETARQYARIIGCNMYRHTVDLPSGVNGPVAGVFNVHYPLVWRHAERFEPKP